MPRFAFNRTETNAANHEALLTVIRRRQPFQNGAYFRGEVADEALNQLLAERDRSLICLPNGSIFPNSHYDRSVSRYGHAQFQNTIVDAASRGEVEFVIYSYGLVFAARIKGAWVLRYFGSYSNSSASNAWTHSAVIEAALMGTRRLPWTDHGFEEERPRIPFVRLQG